MNRKFTEQELIRREKVNKLIENKIAPFGGKFEVTITASDFKKEFDNFEREVLIGGESSYSKEFKIAGRIMSKRGKGKAGFANLQDVTGQIQIYIKEDLIGKLDFNNIWTPMDLGDIIGVIGVPMKTKVGELSIKVSKLIHLTKALKPLPDKHHGLQDVEERLRRRYVDLIVNEESRKIAFTRPKIIRTIQNYLDNKGYIEVETPILQAVLGGASAEPFKTFHNALGVPFYLRIATELPLKRLIVGGMEKVYEIGRLFRNEGVSKKHNPEFTTIELYEAYADMHDMMTITEEIFQEIDREVFNNKKVYEYDGQTVDISKPFKRVHMVDSIKEITGVDFWKELTLIEAKTIAKEKGIVISNHWTGVGHIVNAFFEEFVEETILEPTFIFGHPVDVSPLAKINDKDKRFTDRFEMFMIGREYANAFSELNDPIDQLERFEKQVEEKDLGNSEAIEVDIDYIEALEYGMPPAGGLGIGIDRTIMFFTGASTIREVILFPHNRKQGE